ncbi:MAG: HNH endonuclease [Chloroflexi bacterium]|nr:MAG: HNH endonuclease [Chloroflexota bacterium]
MVFVLDKHKKPLMPCTPKKARLLLSRQRAVVHRRYPFVIRLKDRRLEESVVQPLVLKIDPGSKTSGMAVARVEAAPQGEIHHAVHLAEVGHRGQQVHAAMGARARARRRRRSAHLCYRPPRFENRTRSKGWLPPSLCSRIGNVLTWARRYGHWTPITRLEVERVTFDLHLMQNPEIAGIEYQRGELAGWELRAYLLEKFQHRCVYCHRSEVPFEIDHQIPRSRGGSNRASNLVLSCHDCNAAKGHQTAAEFGHPEVGAQAKIPLKDAAAVNATRYALVLALEALSLPIGTWSGGRTRWNRDRFGLPKTHALDALCVGELAGVHARTLRTLRISASGRGQYCRTLFTRHGFPRGYLMRQKQVNGVQTGDLVLAVVPPPYQAQGTHKGRVAVRKSRFFRINGVDSIPARCCTVLQRSDGYEYAFV